MSCSKCDKNYPIVNKKYGLCGGCNFMRTHNGETQQKVYSDRAALKSQKVYEFKRPLKPLKQQTSKDAKIKSELHKVKAEIELDALQNDEHYCKGCGASHAGLDKSHILAVGYRKDLELEKENIQLMCRACHNIWESKVIEEMIKLHCFCDNLAYIKVQDEYMYNHLYNKLIDYEMRTKCGH